MRKLEELLKKHLYLLTLLLVACSVGTEENNFNTDIYEGLEFAMPEITEPVFPDYSVSVTDFGAVGDGQVLNTQAFADAIQHVAEKGGGKVIIPRGIWLTGPIVLKSNINLYTDNGALVIFSENKDLYPLIETSFEGLNTVRCLSPIYGKNLENIALTGNGVYDGSGDVWRFVKRTKMADSEWKKLVESGGIVDERLMYWFPSESFMKGMKVSSMNVPCGLNSMEEYEEIKDFLRPVMVSLVACKNVLLDGPVFQNSPAWCLHPLMCENLMVKNVSVRNPWYSQNGDGIDIESCKNGAVINCTFDVGDDAICIKSGKDVDGRERAMPTENLIVKNCIVYHGHGGVTVGSEMSGGVKNMHVSGCTFIGTDVGLRFKSKRGRGGIVEGIFISDIDMVNIPTNAISFNMYYGGLSVSEMLARKKGNTTMKEIFEVTEETPQFKNISIKNITCKGAKQAIYLQGLPEMNLENVKIEDVMMEAEKGMFCMDVKGLEIKNMNLKPKHFPAITMINTHETSIDKLELPSIEVPLISVKGEKSEKIKINLISKKISHTILDLDEKVDSDVVELSYSK